MANAFTERGYNLISGGTDNHLMLIDLHSKNLTGKKAQEALEKANITLNKNTIPFDDKSPFITSGIRLGVPAITTRGLKEKDILKVVDLVDRVLTNADNETEIGLVRKEVLSFMQEFPLYPEL